MRVAESAFRHGISEADILHAFRNAVRLVEIEQYGEERLPVIGSDRSGNWLELVAMPTKDADRIIHADRLRPKFYEFLTWGDLTWQRRTSTMSSRCSTISTLPQ